MNHRTKILQEGSYLNESEYTAKKFGSLKNETKQKKLTAHITEVSRHPPN